MNEFRFTKFEVYATAKGFLGDAFATTSKFARPYDYLSNQINRASLSIVLNIAEGTGKADRDFNRYIHNALGSVHEIYAALDVAKDLQLVNQRAFMRLTEQLLSIRKQLGGLSKKLTAES